MRVGFERLEKLANLVVAFQRMPQRQFRVELIPITPPIALTLEITGCDKFGHDALGGTFGNTHRHRDVPKTHPGIFRNAHQNVRVISKKGPVSHSPMIDDQANTLRNTCYKYQVLIHVADRSEKGRARSFGECRHLLSFRPTNQEPPRA